MRKYKHERWCLPFILFYQSLMITVRLTVFIFLLQAVSHRDCMLQYDYNA